MLISFISLSLHSSVWIYAAISFGLLSLAFYYYKSTIPLLPNYKKYLLTALRSASLLLILLILFEPLLSLISSNDLEPSVAIVVDNTQSLTISDKTINSSKGVKSFLNSEFANQQIGAARLKYFSFSSDIKTYQNFSPDSIDFKGEMTDISNSISKFRDKAKEENIQAIVLISDGNYNIGKNPIYSAEDLGIPIFTIGVGDTSEQKDVLVTKVLTNSIAYNETRVPVNVIVRWAGCNGENVEVLLNEGQNILDRKMITLTGGTNETEVVMYYEPKEEGVHKLKVSVSKIADEITEKNNYQSFFIKVLKSKLQALVFAGAPSNDVAVISQTISEDDNIKVTKFIQKNSNEFYERRLTASFLDSADCFVLIGYPTSASNIDVLYQIKNSIDQKRKPLFFIGGKNVDFVKLKILEPYLPFNWTENNSTEMNVSITINEKMGKHPLLNLDGMSVQESWLKLPPVYKTATQFISKPEADVIVNIKIQNVNSSEPLIATRSINRQKSLAITGYGIWRWRLLVQNNPQTEKLLYLFLTNSIRWLTTIEDEKNVKVTPTKQAFTTIDPVEFTGQVYDAQLKPVDNAELKIELSSGTQKSELVLKSIGEGRYEGAVNGIPEGDYNYTAKAVADGRFLGEDKGKFSVGKMNIEYRDTKMNKQILEQIAARTGGMYADIGNASNIINGLSHRKFTVQEATKVKEIEVWNWEYVAAVLILLLSVEWFIRKRSGMV
jgi:hypothetical protein